MTSNKNNISSLVKKKEIITKSIKTINPGFYNDDSKIIRSGTIIKTETSVNFDIINRILTKQSIIFLITALKIEIQKNLK